MGPEGAPGIQIRIAEYALPDGWSFNMRHSPLNVALIASTLFSAPHSFCQGIGVTLRTESDETVCCMLNTETGTCSAYAGEGTSVLGPPTYWYASRAAMRCTPRIGQHRPHILLVVLDDAGFNDFQFGMANRIATPVMNSLAADGVLLNSHYTMPLVSQSLDTCECP